ncbi:hypothetical protein D1BOALGB6SA_5318 [Olavius sp. associated proteobacterium Delta 1]|nr:hypothetical protein D1BOALGB6SA_5318 [Olavius sp. associated proteobacterium Delta 1]
MLFAGLNDVFLNGVLYLEKSDRNAHCFSRNYLSFYCLDMNPNEL